MIKIIRMAQGLNSTLSHLYLNGFFMCYLLEDSIRTEKRFGETCIPEGEFKLLLNTSGGMNKKYKSRFSGMHKGMLEITGIPDFNLIYLHIGNTHKETLGCPLTGRSFEFLNGDYRVIQSTLAYRAVYPELLKEIVGGNNKIEVINHLK